MQSAYEAVDSPRAAFRSRSRVVGAATFLFAAGALAHLGRTAQRPGAADGVGPTPGVQGGGPPSRHRGERG